VSQAYLRDGKHESWRRWLHLGEVDALDDDAVLVLVHAAKAERRERQYLMGRAQHSRPWCGIDKVGASTGWGCGIWMLSHGVVGCALAVEDLEGGIRRSNSGARIQWGSRGEELERSGGNGFMDGEPVRRIVRRRHCSRRCIDGYVWPGEMGEMWVGFERRVASESRDPPDFGVARHQGRGRGWRRCGAGEVPRPSGSGWSRIAGGAGEVPPASGRQRVEAYSDRRSRAVETPCETRGKIGNQRVVYYMDDKYFDSFRSVLAATSNSDRREYI
jgi:hypothetical protein